MSGVVYLYGFVPGDAPAPPSELLGIDGRPVRILETGGFGAATSELDAEAYREGILESRLTDLSWVGRRGVEHEKVVTWFSDHATIVPARLLTLFTSPAAVLEDARERAQVVAQRLERFRDLREWDLKVSYDLSELEAHLPDVSTRAAEIEAEIAHAAPGRRYLLERKKEEMIRAEAPTAARDLARSLLEALEPHAEEAIELEIPAHREGLPVVLDAALLVHPERVDELRREAAEREAELSPVGIRSILTGPWAPYRFMADRDDA